jgi:hypothetical protein
MLLIGLYVWCLFSCYLSTASGPWLSSHVVRHNIIHHRLISCFRKHGPFLIRSIRHFEVMFMHSRQKSMNYQGMKVGANEMAQWAKEWPMRCLSRQRQGQWAVSAAKEWPMRCLSRQRQGQWDVSAGKGGANELFQRQRWGQRDVSAGKGTV